jgi:acetylornithine deacetylase/succinyl-diaminopimelate desuccinylase-like protein
MQTSGSTGGGLVERVLERAIAIQQIPAPTLDEQRRAAQVYQYFQEEGLVDVSQDGVGNVFARIPACAPGQESLAAEKGLPVVVSAHLDTVFPIHIDLSLRREAGRIYAPGIGDNSLGVAGLFGLLWGLQQRGLAPAGAAAGLPADVWLVANVCEEGMGDLRGMRAIVDRFGDQVSAYVIVEGMALGQVYHRGLGVRRYRITAKTAGGHSWADYGQPSAVSEICRLVTQLDAISLPEHPRTTLNVGLIAGGTSINTIAAEAHLDLDLRSEGVRSLETLVHQVEAMVLASGHAGVKYSLEVIGDRPAGKLPTGHPLVALTRKSLEQMGLQPNLSVGSTDANVPLSRGLPAVCIGLTTGGGAHTLNEFIDTRPLAQGLDCLVSLVQGVMAEMPGRAGSRG